MSEPLTAPELARLCQSKGVPYTRQHISRLCRQGKLPGSYQIGNGILKTWVIPYETAIKFIAERKNAES